MPTKSEDLPLRTGYPSNSASPSTPASDNPNNRPASATSVRPDIPNYEILDEIARSEASFVYKACDRRLGKEVAVKISRTQQGTESASLFIDSAKIAARLQHPGIPPVFELGTLPDGRPYQVMKLIAGDTLATLLTERINPVTDRIRFLSVFERLCQTIAFAHAHRVIHRDLSPEHVVIDNFGDVQVIGWSLATTLASDATKPTEQPSIGVPPGTPAYMAPELARGEAEAVDCRSDVFALGGILLEILTGGPPFFGDSALAVHKKAAVGEMSEPFGRLDRCGEATELIAIAKNCLNPNRLLRPVDAGALAVMISSYRAGIEKRARKSEAERLAAESIEIEKKKRRQILAALVLVVGLFVIWTGAMIWWQSKQASVKRMLDGTREQDEKQAQQKVDSERAAQERRTRELQERAILMQKQKRLQLEREQALKKKKETPAELIAPPPREVKRSEP
ncbi:MAG TPA: protein kinase [Gemmata sp.]|nr:protein kinase [Gemmata sp.]